MKRFDAGTPPVLIGSLPGPKLLQTLAGLGFRRLVNLCGVDLAEIYGYDALAGFHCETFQFADVFSAGIPYMPGDELAQLSEARYLEAAPALERQQFLAAIQVTCQALREGEPVFVFCDRGIARSPLVTLAALLRSEGKTLAEGIEAVGKLQPKALFTDISLSALGWSQRAMGE